MELKMRITMFQEEKMKKVVQQQSTVQLEVDKSKHRDGLRQQYFETQRRNIEDFKLQKETTESLLMIKIPQLANHLIRNKNQQQI